MTPTEHHKQVVRGLSDCKCRVTDCFEIDGQSFMSVKFSDDCIDPQLGINALLDSPPPL